MVAGSGFGASDIKAAADLKRKRKKHIWLLAGGTRKTGCLKFISECSFVQTCIIIANGDINDYKQHSSMIEETDFIVCADGALDMLWGWGLFSW